MILSSLFNNSEVGCGVWGVGCRGIMNYELGRWGSGEIELKPQNPKTPTPKRFKFKYEKK